MYWGNQGLHLCLPYNLKVILKNVKEFSMVQIMDSHHLCKIIWLLHNLKELYLINPLRQELNKPHNVSKDLLKQDRQKIFNRLHYKIEHLQINLQEKTDREK